MAELPDLRSKKMSKEKEPIKIKQTIALGVAGAVGSMAVQLNACPLGASQNPVANGEAVFKKTFCVVGELLRRKK